MSNQQDTKQKNPNVPNLRFASFHDSWQRISIGSFFEERVIFTSDFQKYPLYTFSIEDGVTPKTERFERGFLVKKSGDVFKVIHPGEFIINPMNLRFGAINYCKTKNPVSVSGYYDVFVIENKLNNDFWLALLSNSSAIKLYNSIATGSLLEKKRVHYTQLCGLKLFVPSPGERSRIARFFKVIDKRIQVQNKIIEEREASIKTIFLSLDAGAKQKICLGDVGEYKACDNLSWDEIGVTGRPAIIYGELFTAYRYLINTVRSRTTRNLKSVSTGNDLLFPSSTTVDAISLIAPAALMQQGVVLGGDMFSIAVKDDIDPIYLSFLINCRYKKALSKYAQGSTIIHMHYDDIKRFPIELVSTQKQREISAVMSSYLSLIEKEKTKLALFRREKEFFLRNMFI